jgi:two-component system sensor histidine kinase QseC
MKSLRTWLIFRLLVGGGLLLGAAGAVLHWQVSRALSTQFDATLRASARSVANLTEQKHGKTSVEFAGENMPQFERQNGSDIFLVRTIDGREIARSASLGAATLPLRAGTLEAPEFFDGVLPDGRPLRFAGVRFTPLDEDDDSQEQHPKPEQVVLVVGGDHSAMDHTLAVLRTSLLVVGAGALAVLAALVNWEVRSGLAPLDRLSLSVAAVGAGSLATRFPVEPLPAELQPIAARLNELLARLGSAFDRERRVTATAAHEFRTPLAELRALAEVNLTTPATEAERAESWRDALATTLRMETLALRLLDLSRAEDAACVLNRESISLSAAFAAAWKPSATLAAERNLTLENTLPADLSVQTDPILLGIILGNLCANAAAHATAATALRISARSSTGGVTLHFHNHAADLTPADVPHLFERFWRKDPSRADAQHHGLGLSLAAEFAKLIGGSLTAHLFASGNLEFALWLPASGR